MIYLLIPITAFVNMVRGGLFGLSSQTNRILAFLLLCISTYVLTNQLLFSAITLIVFFVWQSLEWGRWYTLGRQNQSWRGNPDKYSVAWLIEYIPRLLNLSIRNFDRMSLLIRHMILIPIMCILVMFNVSYVIILIALFIAILNVISYEIAWCLYDRKIINESTIRFAECLVGINMGILFLILYTFI